MTSVVTLASWELRLR